MPCKFGGTSSKTQSSSWDSPFKNMRVAGHAGIIRSSLPCWFLLRDPAARHSVPPWLPPAAADSSPGFPAPITDQLLHPKHQSWNSAGSSPDFPAPITARLLYPKHQSQLSFYIPSTNHGTPCWQLARLPCPNQSSAFISQAPIMELPANSSPDFLSQSQLSFYIPSTNHSSALTS